MKTKFVQVFVVLLGMMTIGLGQASAQGFSLPPLLVESNAFEDGGIVPPRFVASGDNIQPDFTISNAPDTTVAYAIIFHDLDVSLNGSTDDVLHWLVWDIPVSAGGIPEGSLPAGSVTGTNLMQQTAYFGPGAPAGPRYHHYVFEFYALSEEMGLTSTAGREELMAAMEGKIVAKAAYVGRYRSGE
jgi:Raf kinase inhibitor-like YbhB/YbcL family protein